MNWNLKERLKRNWGEKAEALDCYAEARYFDPLSSWCCYVFAMDSDEKQVYVLLYSNVLGAEVSIIDLEDLSYMYNELGQSPMLDTEFRRIHLSELIRRLNK